MRHPFSLLFLAGLLAGEPTSAAERVYVARTASGLSVYTNQPPREAAGDVRMVELRSTYPSQRRKPARDASPLFSTEIDTLIRLAAATYGVEEALLRAIIHVESRFNPRARSPRGALGLMQLMPATASRYGVVDRRDPAQNIDGGTRHLKHLLATFKGNVRLALAAYNAGEAAVTRYGNRVPPFAETQAYVPAVLARYRAYSTAQSR